MTHNFSTLQAEISAINAANGLLERSIEKETNLPLEVEPDFDFVQVLRTFHIMINGTGYFEEFDLATRPDHLKYIREIKRINEVTYWLITRIHGTGEQIQKELDSLYLPF